MRVSSVQQENVIRNGFVSFLISKGYQPGRSLFWLDYSGESGKHTVAASNDPALLARDLLAPYVRGVIAATGAPSVDIITHGTGALVARYYLSYFGGAERVRTLAMIAPPNRGSFAASYYRLAGTIAAQGRFRSMEGLGRGEVLDEGVLNAPFLDETLYVAQAAHGFFEPLFSSFSASTLFLRRPSQRHDVESFESWLARTHPRLYRLAFSGAGQLPDKVLPDGIGFAPGEQLSRAYFHVLALAVTRNNYRNLTPWTEVITYKWEEDISRLVDIKGDWRAAATEFVMRRLIRVAEEAMRRLGVLYGRQALVSAVQALTGEPPDSPAVAAQVEDVIRPGSPLWSGPNTISGNVRLASLNARDEKRRLERRTRFVIVVGVAPNLWAGFFPKTGANDLFTEARSGLLPPGPLDASLVYASLLGSSRDRLPWQRGVQEYIFRRLDPLSPVGERLSPPSDVLNLRSRQMLDGSPAGAADGVSPDTLPLGGRPTVLWSRGGVQDLTLTEPFTLSVDLGGSRLSDTTDGTQLSLRVTPPADLPKGATLLAFIAGIEKGQPRLLVSSLIDLAASGDGQLALPLNGDLVSRYGTTYYAGFRLLPDDAIAASPGILRQGRAWRMRYEVSLERAAAGEADASSRRQPLAISPGIKGDSPGLGGSVLADDPLGGDEKSLPPVGDGKRRRGQLGKRHGQDSGKNGHAAAEKGVGARGGAIPEIIVTYHNKRTTDKEEDRTYHVRWEWDFGDGTGFEDTDPSHVVSRVEHYFQEGEYEVRARSWSNKGTLLREMRWEVKVGPNGAKAVFKTGRRDEPPPADAVLAPMDRQSPHQGSGIVLTAESIREPYPEIALQGPGTWVTGRQAWFSLRVSVPEVKFLKSWAVDFYPGREFLVRWRRPGVFTVRAAVKLTLRFDLPEGPLILKNTYVVTRDVNVMATSVTG